MLQFLILFIALVAVGLEAKVSYVDKCRQTDFKCLTKMGENVIPHIIHGNEALGIPPMDPLMIDELKITGDLNLIMTDIIVKDLGKCTINKIERDLAQSTLTLDITCPVSMTGKCDINGKLLFLDVKGKGAFEIKGDKMNIVVTTKVVKFKNDNKEYYKSTDFDVKYEPLSRVDLNFENFGGINREAVETLLKQNWREVVMSDVIGKPILKALSAEVLKVINKFLENLPIDEFEIA